MPTDIGHNEADILEMPFPLPTQKWDSMVHGFVDRAVFFANRNRPSDDIHNAWRTFRVWLSPWLDYNSDDWRLFLVWYVFHWQSPMGEGEETANFSVSSIAEQYVEECPEEVSLVEQKMIAVATKSPLDFYEIYKLPELDCYYVKSLFLGYLHSYAFAELPKGLKVGDVFFGKLIHFQEDKGVVAGHSRPFPPNAKVSIAHLRRHLINGRKEEFINNFSLFDSDLFNLYHDLIEGKGADC